MNSQHLGGVLLNLSVLHKFYSTWGTLRLCTQTPTSERTLLNSSTISNEAAGQMRTCFQRLVSVTPLTAGYFRRWPLQILPQLSWGGGKALAAFVQTLTTQKPVHPSRSLSKLVLVLMELSQEKFVVGGNFTTEGSRNNVKLQQSVSSASGVVLTFSVCNTEAGHTGLSSHEANY